MHVALVMTTGNMHFSGGVAAVTLQRARFLVSMGHVVSVVCMGGPDFIGHVERDGFHVYPRRFHVRLERPFGRFLTFSPWYLMSLGRALAEAHARRPVDLVDLQDGPAILGIAPFLRSQNVPMTFTVNSSALLNPAPRPKLGRQLHIRYERRAAALAQRVLIVSEAMREAPRQYGVPDSRIDLIPNPVPDDAFENGGRRKSRNSSMPLRLLALGRVDVGKRVDVALRALAKLPLGAATLDVVGEGPALVAMQELATSLGISDRVTFHGTIIDRAEVLSLLSRADVLPFPSVFESFGLALAEAMASGVYPLVADVEPMRSMVPRENVFPVDDVEVLAFKLQEIIENPDILDAARPGLQMSARQYASDTVLPRLLQIYEDVAAQRSLAPSP